MKKTSVQNYTKRSKLADEQRQVIPIEGRPNENGGFEILAITAGEGNGWIFTPECLSESVPLWDQAQCFIDHSDPQNGDGHSIRDLAGVLITPVWDEATQGIRCTLIPMGPAAELLTETGKQILATEGINARIGFSADLAFSNDGMNVVEILQIFSVDLVVDPARGGVFLRALNSVQNRQRGESRISQLATETAQARALRNEMCKHVLDTALSGAGLPKPMSERIRSQFSNRIFEPAELSRAIEDGRTLCGQLLAPSSIAGLSNARFSQMVSGRDQISAAIHDLLGAKRPNEIRHVRTAKLSGIRELYTLMTGDYDFHGGYDRSRAQFSDSSDLPNILKNTLNKLVAQRWDELGASGYRWWEPIVTIEHFNNLQDITGILVGEVTLLPSVSEGAAYHELSIADSSETGTWTKYGGYLGLTIEMFERDDTLRLRQFPFKLATSALRNISAKVAEIFISSSGFGPVMADGKAVFHSADHKNTGTALLTSVAWEAACSAIYNQNMLTAPIDLTETAIPPVLAVDGRYLVVPRALRLTAQRILYPTLAYEAHITSENMQRGQFGDVITCPEFSNPKSWAVVADPQLAPAIYVGERFGLLPEIYIADNQLSGALFTNDEVRVKARHFLSVFVADYRPLYKSNAV